MKSPHNIFKGNSLWTKALFQLLLSSVLASKLRRVVTPSDQPGYHCRSRVVTFTQVEATLEAACFGFILPRADARRPLVFIEDDNDENLIFEWSIPSSATKHPSGKRQRSIGKIIFDNSCELKDVVYYDHNKQKYKSCVRVPDVSTSTTPGKTQDTTELLARCGSLSWDIESIQNYALHNLYFYPDKFDEVNSKFDQADGPWRKVTLKKIMMVKNRPHSIPYEISINQYNAVRGIVVTHFISRKVSLAHKGTDNPSSPKTVSERQSIKIACLLDKKFPLFLNQNSNDSNPLKRKTPT